MTQRNAGTRGRENESVQFTLRVPYSTWSGLSHRLVFDHDRPW